MATHAIDRALLADLRARNLKSVTISYSGGNDDGGCDGASAIDTDDQPVELSDVYVHEASGYERDEAGNVIAEGTMVRHHWRQTGDRGTYYAPATSQEVADAALVKRLCAPVYARYGSFAGDFSCHGTLVYDVAGGQLEMTGYESSYSEVGW